MRRLSRVVSCLTLLSIAACGGESQNTGLIGDASTDGSTGPIGTDGSTSVDGSTSNRDGGAADATTDATVGDAQADARTDAAIDASRDSAADSATDASTDSAVDAAACPMNTSACGTSCVDKTSDRDHCGDCDNRCGNSEACVSGVCSTTCPTGQRVCGGTCSTVATDNQNCGDCGTVCGAGTVCSNGSCTTSCASNLTTCTSDGGAGDGGQGATYCANTADDNQNCGTCGNACGAGHTCTAGECVLTCALGNTKCTAFGGDGGVTGEYCANLQNDSQNCNACGNACAAGQACVGGTCTATCGSGFSFCAEQNGPGYCANLESDPANCNACGNACAPGFLCNGGTCAPSCMPFTTCPAVGMEPAYCADTTTDGANCGTCGNTCTGGRVCSGSQCVFAPLNVTTDTNLSTTNTNGRTCADGGDMVSYSVASLTGTTATLAGNVADGCLVAGDQLLLMNLRGTTSSTLNVGNYERLVVASVAGNVVTFTASKTKNYGSGADDADIGALANQQRVVLQRVPVYSTVTVGFGATLSANAWDGRKGGVFSIHSNDAITVIGTVSMKGAGYAGGATVTTVNTTGAQGETISGVGSRDERNAMGGGGGGFGDNSGCGPQGFPGGGGGYGESGTRSTAHCGGQGGGAYGSPTLSKLFFGSGGGAGGTDDTLGDNPQGGAGGAGGGIILLESAAATIVNGSVDASGAIGTGDTAPDCTNTGSNTSCYDFSGPGGGGAGGSVRIVSPTVVRLAGVSIEGGRGGFGNRTFGGLGGNGSIGRMFPMPQSCSDLSNAYEDRSTLFALGGDATKVFHANCVNVGSANAKMYLVLPNTGGSQNFSRYDATRLDGENGSTTVTTRFTRVALDPSTGLIDGDNYTYATSSGRINGGPFVGGQFSYARTGDCACDFPRGTANVDLRGTGLAIDDSVVWTPAGSGQSGSSTQLFGGLVANLTGGGCCGENAISSNGGDLKVKVATVYTSCQAIKTAIPTATDGFYSITPNESYPDTRVYCDMTTDGGGFTLLSDSAANASGIQGEAETIPALPGVASALPAALVRAIAAVSTQAHLRTAGLAATQSFTTVANTQPIINLRDGRKLNAVGTPVDTNTQFLGPRGGMSSFIWYSCPPGPKGFPEIYHACNNGFGLHAVGDTTKWNLQQGAQDALQLYVR